MKKLITALYISYWVVVYLQGEESLMSIILIASMIGYILLNITYEAIDNRR